MRWLPAMLIVLGLAGNLAPHAAAHEFVEGDLDARVDLCIITYRPSAGFTRIDVIADQQTSDENMTALLTEIDTDDDGIVTAWEVTAYEKNHQRVERSPQTMGALKLILDGTHATSVTLQTVLVAFEGRIDENRPRLVTEHRAYFFNPSETSISHVMEGGLYAEAEIEGRAVIEFVVLEAPAGWLVGRVNETNYGAKTVDLEAFNTHSYFSVRFDPISVDEGPWESFVSAPAASLLIGFLGALLWTVRRRL